MRLVPVDHDPFAATPQSAGAGAPAQPRLEPVDYDPFAVSPSADAAQSARGGFAQGVARWLGGPADLAGVIAHGADFVRSKITGQPIEQVAAEADANARVPRSSVERFGSEAIGSAMRSNFAARNPGQADPMDHKPVTRVGKYLHAIGEAAPMAPLGPISTAVGAVVGEAGAQAAEHYAGGPGVASEAARAAGNMFGPTALARVITPVVTPRHLVRHNQVLEREGVPITAGQATGNPRLRARPATFLSRAAGPPRPPSQPTGGSTAPSPAAWARTSAPPACSTRRRSPTRPTASRVSSATSRRATCSSPTRSSSASCARSACATTTSSTMRSGRPSTVSSATRWACSSPAITTARRGCPVTSIRPRAPISAPPRTPRPMPARAAC